MRTFFYPKRRFDGDGSGDLPHFFGSIGSDFGVAGSQEGTILPRHG
jgi:hypothetical protein